MTMPPFDLYKSIADELLPLALQLQQSAEPGYRELKTRSIWENFAHKHGLLLHFMVEGTAPVITLGDFGHVRYNLVFTADLDAVWESNSQQWLHLCGHHVQSVHAFALALLYQRAFFSQDIAIRLIGSPAEECLPAFFPKQVQSFVPGKRRLYEEGAFAKASAVLSTHVADHLPTRAVVLARGAYGLLWLRFNDDSPVSWDLHTDNIAYIEEFLGSHLVDIAAKDRDVRIRTRSDTDGTFDFSSEKVMEHLRKRGAVVSLVAEYPPLQQDLWWLKQARRVLRSRHPDIACLDTNVLYGFTDLGVLSGTIPVCQLFVGGTRNMTHDPSFTVEDESFTYIWAGFFAAQLIQTLTFA